MENWLAVLIDSLRWYLPFPRFVRKVSIPMGAERPAPIMPLQYLSPGEPLIIGGWE